MKSLWSDTDAKAAIKHYAKQGVNEDVALRTYTTRLLGNDPTLVLHGGGNTSVKTVMKDVAGESVDVLCVKGSGWDMGDIEPAGLPAVRMAPILKLLKLKTLSDEDMVSAQRANLIDQTSPNPSVETLLHAFLPHKFIDHTHSTAVLALTNQPDGEKLCREVWGDEMAYVPYIMPGFLLAKAAAEIYAANPKVKGLILLKHGIFTFGDTAKDAYTRMTRMVSKAEKAINGWTKKRGKKAVFAPAKLPKALASVADVAPILRGLTAQAVDADRHDYKPMVMDFRTSKAIRAFVDGKQVSRYGRAGTATPDHVIRTKPKPLVVPAPQADKLDTFVVEAGKALDAYVAEYGSYFARGNKTAKPKKTQLDAMPRVILVPGLGLFGLGATKGAAAIAADLTESNVGVITDAEARSRFESLPEQDVFDMEYWSLEQAKLGKAAEKPLARQVCVVTGGGSGIGAATAKAFRAQGCEVAVLDVSDDAAQGVAGAIGGLGLGCDVTDGAAVRAAFDAVAETYGGVDIVVSNAGAAWQGAIGDLDDATLRQSFELNFFSHQSVCQAAVNIMRAQATGGCLLFNTSKQAINPGPNFGAYGLPKAALMFLMRQYALDHGADGIRTGAVNADRIRSGLLDDSMIKTRSKARGLSEKDYMSGNLLGLEVTAEDVAQAFVDLAKAKATTASVTTVDGGNIAAALR